MKLINSTLNGQITYCPCHDLYHLEFGNFYIQLSKEELTFFSRYVNSIDYEFFLQLNKNTCNKRKLLLQVQSHNILFCLNVNEFLELRDLLSLKKRKNKMFNIKELAEMEFSLN